jgi:Na+/H+-translocating membrane pyrophosphatase
MQDLAGLIETGAMAFLRREYMALLPFIAIVAILLGWAVSYPDRARLHLRQLLLDRWPASSA